MVQILVRVKFGRNFRKSATTRSIPPEKIEIFLDNKLIATAFNVGFRPEFDVIDETFVIETSLGNHVLRSIITRANSCGGGLMSIDFEGEQIAIIGWAQTVLNPCGINTALINFTLLEEPPQLELIEPPFTEPVITPPEQQNGINLKNIAIIGAIILLLG